MHVYHMKRVTEPHNDAYVVASCKAGALKLYNEKYGHEPDYSMCMDCGEASILVEEKTE